jgi:TonB family protein
MKRSIVITVLAVLAVGWVVIGSPTYTFAQDQAETRKVVNRVNPPYPAIARTMGLKGTVKVEATVLANGTVKSVEIKGGHPVLAEATADAVRRWKWVPAAHDTKEPVTVKFEPQ